MAEQPAFRCPICNAPHQTCGGPTTTKPIEFPYDEPPPEKKGG